MNVPAGEIPQTEKHSFNGSSRSMVKDYVRSPTVVCTKGSRSNQKAKLKQFVLVACRALLLSGM